MRVIDGWVSAEKGESRCLKCKRLTSDPECKHSDSIWNHMIAGLDDGWMARHGWPVYSTERRTWIEERKMPKGSGVRVMLMLIDGRIVGPAHFAQNLEGEEQPPFHGWYSEDRYHLADDVDVVAWRFVECPAETRTSAAAPQSP